MTDFAAAFADRDREIAARPAAQNPATFGEIWRSEWNAAGLDTMTGVGQPWQDASSELDEAYRQASGETVFDAAMRRGVKLPTSSFDGRADAVRQLAADLDPSQRATIEPFLDVRKRARDKAAAIEKQAAEISDRSFGLSGAAVGFLAGVARQAVDPVNLATLPLGAARGASVLRMLGTEAAIGFGTQAAQEPFIQAGREKLALEAGLGQAVTNSVEAGLGAAGLAGLFRGAGYLLRRGFGAEAAPVLARAEAPAVAEPAGAAALRVPDAGTAPLRPLAEPDPALRSALDELAPEDFAAVAHLVERDGLLDAAAPIADDASRMLHGRQVDLATELLETGRIGGFDEAAGGLGGRELARAAAAAPDPAGLARVAAAAEAPAWREALRGHADVAIVDVSGFGPVLHGLQDRWADAVAILRRLESGEARAVLTHPQIAQPIDVIWGKDKGLSSILRDHPEIVPDLPARLAAARIESASANRIVLASPDTRAVIRLDFDGESKHWLMTAYEPRERRGRRAENTTERPDGRQADTSSASPAAASIAQAAGTVDAAAEGPIRRMGARAQTAPLSLSQFIARNGGLELSADAAYHELNRVFVPAGGPLARKSGRSIDGFWRERLIEEGYLPRDADGGMARDIRDELFALLDEERRGRRTYRQADLDRVADRADSAAFEAGLAARERDLDAAAQRIRDDYAAFGGDELDSRAVYEAAEMMLRGEETNPLDAFERALVRRELNNELSPVRSADYDLPDFDGDAGDALQRGTARESGGEAGSGGGSRGEPGQAQGFGGAGGELPRPSEGGRSPLGNPALDLARDPEAAARLADVARALDAAGDLDLYVDGPDGKPVKTSARQHLAALDADATAAAELKACLGEGAP